MKEIESPQSVMHGGVMSAEETAEPNCATITAGLNIATTGWLKLQYQTFHLCLDLTVISIGFQL